MELNIKLPDNFDYGTILVVQETSNIPMRSFVNADLVILVDEKGKKEVLKNRNGPKNIIETN